MINLRITIATLFVFWTNINSAPTNIEFENSSSIDNSNDNNYNNNNNNNNNSNVDYLANEKIIDINNPDESDIEQLHFLNINITALRQKQLELQNRNRQNDDSNYYADRPVINPIILSNDSIIASHRKRNEELALDAIKKTIEANILRNSSNEHPPELSSGDSEHYTAAHEICEVPKNTNASSWNEDNTWNLYFLPPNHRNVHMTLAILRLYKKEITSISQNNTDCLPDDLIRITVSVYMKKKSRDRKKRLCSSIMISRGYTGWIEFDIKTAIKLWDKPNRNMGLAVDVQDQDELSLKASNFFELSQCQQDSRFHGLFTKTPALWINWVPCPDIQELM